MAINKVLKRLALVALVLVPSVIFAETGKEAKDTVISSSDIQIHLDSGIDKNNVELLKKYELPVHLDNEIRNVANSEGVPIFSVDHQVSVTVTEFHFRTGSFFSKGNEGKDFLRADVEISSIEEGVKKFAASAAVTKGLTKSGRVKQLARELANQIASTME